MSPRLTSAMLVSVLIRRVSAEGGFATVMRKGDADAGAILLICQEKGHVSSVRERLLSVDGRYAWQSVGPDDMNERDAWMERRQARDPDLWIVELDIVDAERFADETSLTG